jgi:myo-inositol-1(or 4)-monophosphatase
LDNRAKLAVAIAKSGGALGNDYFQRAGSLPVEEKGHQDFVTEADKAVERHIRRRIEDAFPHDAIVGEEHDPKPGTSGYIWVIDPIDGTANFVSSIPAWTVVVALVKEEDTKVGVIFDPCNDDIYLAIHNQGAWLNGKAIHCSKDRKITQGAIAIGLSDRKDKVGIQRVIGTIIDEGGVFYRNASGALSLAYVATGRLVGYLQDHMKPWDCLAGQLLVSEAGGQIEPRDASDMIKDGGRVVAGGTGVFDQLVKIADASFDLSSR